MGLTTAYLVASGRLPGLLQAIQNAEAPTRFTLRFIEDLEFKSTNDRLIIGVLQGLGFLDTNRAPTDRYFRFLDKDEGPRVLAEGIRDAYEDLFRVKKDANTLSQSAVKNKLKSLLQGKPSDSVLGNMAKTFVSLVKEADFDNSLEPIEDDNTDSPVVQKEPEESGSSPEIRKQTDTIPSRSSIASLNYRIEITLPSTRDKTIYDAIFRSLKEHLL